MTPSERLLRQHQQQQHPRQPSTSHPSHPSHSSEDPVPKYPSHNEPGYDDHWQHHPSDQSSQDPTMHRPSRLCSSPDRQQEQQSNLQQHHHPPFFPQQKQKQHQHPHQRHEHEHDLPLSANPSQRFETNRGEGMSTIHSPRGHHAEPTHGRRISPPGPGQHSWTDYHGRGQDSPSQAQYAQQQSDHSYAYMQTDHHARFAPSSMSTYNHHLERDQELAPPGDRVGPGTTDVRLSRHQHGLTSESARLPQAAAPPSSVLFQDHGTAETRLDRSFASPSPAAPAAHLRTGSSASDAMSQQHTAADRHYVLTSRSSASISQQRLSHAVHHSDMGRHEPPQPALVMSTSPGSENTTLTSRTGSIEASPTTMSSQRNHDHFMLDLMPGREKTPRTPQRIPPPILTKWRSDDSNRDCPPLSFQSNSSQSFSIRSADSKMSPSTPRSTLMHPLMGRPLLDHPMHGYDKPYLPAHVVSPPLFLTESPVGYHEPSHSYTEEHDMEHCSEQDDVRAREHGEGDDDDDDDEDEEENMRATKRVHLNSRRQASVHGFEDGAIDPDLSIRSPSAKSSKASVTDSPQREAKGAKKASPRAKVQSPRRTIRPLSAQMTTDESSEHMEDGGNNQEGFGVHSLHGKGLGYYAPLLCERVRAKGTTTYNELVHELAGGQPGEVPDISPQEQSGQGNIRRRVYDALNILESLGIISMDKKAIRWIGIQDSCIIREATKRVGNQELFPMTEGDRADESEEPEDDDMDIEQLQKEVDALRLQNQLEKAKVEDQIARHVQVNNLIRRNKLAEEKEMERLERRRLRKLEKKAERRAQDGREGSHVPDDEHSVRSEKKSSRHTRHRSPRLQSHVDEEEDSGADEPMKVAEGEASMEVESSGDPCMDEEEARRLRKAQRQERRERKERKEKRAQRRQEREAAARIEQERIGLPCIVLRMPGYGAQSSDSEGSIQVVRRVREEPRPRKSHGSRRTPGEVDEETEMTTTVEVRVSQQDELNVISDTEILGELRLNNVGMNDLQAMLPKKDIMDNVRYSTATTEELEAAAGAAMATSEALAASGPRVTVLSGFERQMMKN